jgi:citrate lyase subunit beta / citryl-CoA lyase
MRSMLFVPADSEKKLAKGMTSGADALIVDLEDSVAPGNKAAARGIAAAFLKSARQVAKRPKLYVRINALDTAWWRDDVAGVIAALPDGIMQPKTRSGADVETLSAALDTLEPNAGIKVGATRIIAIATEVPVSVLNMATYVPPHPRIEGYAWGAEDLSALLGSQSTREADGRSWTTPYVLARNLCLMAATAAERQPLDTVYVNFRDLEGLRLEAEMAARDGFTGKMAIHPDQVAIINAAFTPSEKEVAWAHEIVQLFKDNPGAGTIGLRGQMIDRPHLMRAERILARIA